MTSPVTMIQTRDPDTIQTVETYRQRKGIRTFSKALEKLVQKAKEAGLHVQDEPGSTPEPTPHASGS